LFGITNGMGVYHLTLVDQRIGTLLDASFCGVDSRAARSSVDWIVESHDAFPQLLNFGQVDFSNSGSSNESIFAPIAFDIVGRQLQSPHVYIKAYPSPLSADGKSFSVYWNHN
jgi:hypothetical protein